MRLSLGAQAAVVHDDGRRVALAALDAALLAWLALEGPTPRARLAQLLWPDSAPDAARNALRQRLFQLKRQFGDALLAGQSNLALAPGLAHDLDQADDLLGGANLGGAGELGQWLALQRQRRRQRLVDSLAELADMAEQARDWPDALAHAEELLALQPLSEDAHRRVMRLHYLAGDRAAALLAFDRCEQRLKDEVGARPSPATLALLATVEAAAALASAGPEPRAVPAAVLRPPRLIGRDAEWRVLAQAWAAAQPVLVLGEAGLGKSRLLGDFAAGRSGVLVAGARPGDAGVAYGSVSRLLRALGQPVLQALPEPLRRALAQLLPELGRADADDSADPATQRTRLFNAVAAVLDTTGGTVFDDLHYADEASLELLRFVVDGARKPWLLAARSAELGEAGGWLTGAGMPRTLTLAPLTRPQLQGLCVSLALPGLDADAMAPALLRHTGGNPLFLLETLKAWLLQARSRAADAAAPASWLPALPRSGGVATLIRQRITRLSPRAVQLARCAAIAAPDFDAELAAAVLGCRTLDLADPWAELEAAQVLHDGCFVHDLVYESALASVPAPVARQLHAEVAAYLARRGGEPARLAHHWREAGRWQAAADAEAAAADRARDAGRPAEQARCLAAAAELYGRAGLPDKRFDAALRRARVLAIDQPGEEAVAAAAELATMAADGLQGLLALEVRLELGMTRQDGDAPAQLAQAAQAQDAAARLGRHELALKFLLVRAGLLCDARRAEQAVDLLQAFPPVELVRAGLEVRWQHASAMALALDYAGRLRDALPEWERARVLAAESGRSDMLWKCMHNAASTQAKLGLVHEAAAASEQAHRLAQADGGPPTLRTLQMQVTLGHRLRDCGRLGRALALLEDALAGLHERGASQADLASAEHRLAQLMLQLGRPEQAARLLAAERPGTGPALAALRLAHRAVLAQQLGQPGGLALARDAWSLLPGPQDVNHQIVTLFASELMAPDEGEAAAAGLAQWATARDRLGLALAGHVRAAGHALLAGAPRRALPHAEAALHLAQRHRPDSFYLPEMWLTAQRVLRALGRDDEARARRDEGRAWIAAVLADGLPEAFHGSFRQRNAVNRALLEAG